MTDTELRALIRESVEASMREHACRLTEEERRFVHSMADNVDRKRISSLVSMMKFWDTAEAWVVRMIVAALIALVVWGISKLGGSQ